jgi:hypothetical protein
VAVVVTVAKGYDLGYVWKNQAHKEGAEHRVGGYYINAAQAGESPGRWWGPGAQALGFAAGQVVEREPYDAVYQQHDPRTGEKLGRSRGNYLKFSDHLVRLLAAEPHATAERLIELEREAAKAARQPAAYTDVTISFSKSISVLHASIRENARRTRLAGDQRAEAYWAGREERFQEILHGANRAALEYLQTWAGVTRTGYHGVRVDGQEPGRFEAAGLIITSWLQGTSRDGDPQDHIHNQIARITRTFSDGKWRAHDTASLRTILGALQAVAATAAECELTHEFGVEWVPRPDGRGNEIKGITQAQMDAYSTRTVAVHEKERELAQSWERRNGRAPNSRELLHITSKATLQSRNDKSDGEIDWDALAQQWDATIGGELAGIGPAVSNARGPGANAPRAANEAEPGGVVPGSPPSRAAQKRALQKALVLVSDKHPAWTRHDLLKQLALVMPPGTRYMDSRAAQELLGGLAEEALSGRAGDVVCLEAPEWPPLPASLRRELDGRSVYTRPGVAPYATATQLSREDKLITQAQAQTAPRLPREQAARRLGANAALLEAQLRERAQDAREHATDGGLRLDQAAAIWYALTSPRTVEVVTGPAGTGKTRVLAAAAHAWGGPVTGTATSQNATNELRQVGVTVAANTTQLLANLSCIRPGSLIVVDEGSMVSITHLAALVDHATRHGCKLVLAGDQEQLAAVEGGGAMMLLAGRLGYVQLAEPVRFRAEWERDASLRLRQGDPAALDDYDQHGRIRGAPPDEAMEQAAKAYVASYLAGHDVILTAGDWARCRELSRRIRDDLIHLGLVDDGSSVQIAEGAEASVGDLVICRDNDHQLEAGQAGRGLANGDILRIEAITSRGLVVRRLLESDPATGQRRFTERVFTYTGHRSCDLAYAVSGHSAQGGTVHTGITLATGNEDRQWLYAALTRGTDNNLVFVSTTPARVADPAPGTRPAPELDRYERNRQEREGYLPAQRPTTEAGGPDPREPIAVLADILDRDGAQLSATETRQRNLANADHLAILGAIWAAETRQAQDARYQDLVMAALPPGYRHQLSPQERWLYRTLRSAELADLDPAEVTRTAIASRDLVGARDVASVIDARIRQRVYPLLPQPQGPWAERVPRLPDAGQQAYLAELAAMMDGRKQRLGEYAAQTAPAWAVKALGAVPEDPAARQEWVQKASAIGAYREMYGHQHPNDPIGPEPTHDSPDQRAAWHEAFAALGPTDGPDVRAMPDGRLWLIRDTYTTETCWAPQHVGKELRLVRLGAANAELDAIRAGAEADTARKQGDHERASRHEAWAASYRAMRDRYQAQEGIFAATMNDRQQWEHATEHTRHLGVAADVELRRRHPDQQIEPLRSAEAAPVEEAEREQLTLAPDEKLGQMAQWVHDLAAQGQAFSEKIQERKALRVPSEDPDWEDLGHAFPAWNPPDKDAILQPPKPQITPSATILQLAAEHDQAPEAGE